VVDLGHDRPGLEERIAAFAAGIRPMLVAADRRPQGGRTR